MFGIVGKYISNGNPRLHLYKRDFGSTSIALGFNKGSFDQPNDKPGLAHFAEHMLIKESKNYPDMNVTNILLTEKGISSNAHVNLGNTRIVFNVPDESDIEIAIDIFLDKLFYPLSLQERIENERTAIITELRSNKQDNLTYSRYLIQNAILGIKTTEWSFNGGSEETINNLTLIDIAEFMKENYSLDNLHICAFGNFDVLRMKKLIESKMHHILNTNIGKNIESSKHYKPAHIEYTPGENKLNILQEAYKIDASNSKNAAIAMILRRYLTATKSAYLPTELRNKLGLIYGVESSLMYGLESDYFLINYQVIPEKYSKFRKQKNLLYTKLCTNKPDELLFDTVKNFILKISNKWFESSDQLRDAFLLYELANKNYTLFDVQEELNKITYHEFSEYIKNTFNSDAIASVVVR